ncbi:MAG: Flp family type IVb pilin [Planctomycetaceae bacterium]|nr:Flp family type IVb pilin [Planctomycetaceae bacterium]
MKAIQNFLRAEDAATAVEYAVMLAMIIMTAIAAISSFGSSTNGLWGKIDTDLNSHGF